MKNGIEEKSEKFRQEIKDGGYDDFLLENELDVELMGIKELRYFATIMKAGKLDIDAVRKYNGRARGGLLKTHPRA